MRPPNADIPQKHADDDPPPVLGTWTNVYKFVVVFLAVLIAIFYAFTKAFAP